MKNQICKVSSVLAIASFLMVIVISNAFSFGVPSLTGGKKKGKVDISALADNQANLCKRLCAALGEINKAQYHFAKALDDKKTMESLEQTGKLLAKGNLDKDALNQTMGATANVAELQNDKLKEAKKWDASKKRELQKGLMPYATGTAHSVLLGKEFADHLKSTKDAIQQAGVTGALSVKKKLGLTLYIAPNVPKLVSNLLTTANTATKIAKKEKLNVSEPEKMLANLDI